MPDGNKHTINQVVLMVKYGWGSQLRASLNQFCCVWYCSNIFDGFKQSLNGPFLLLYAEVIFNLKTFWLNCRYFKMMLRFYIWKRTKHKKAYIALATFTIGGNTKTVDRLQTIDMLGINSFQTKRIHLTLSTGWRRQEL